MVIHMMELIHAERGRREAEEREKAAKEKEEKERKHQVSSSCRSFLNEKRENTSRFLYMYILANLNFVEMQSIVIHL